MNKIISFFTGIIWLLIISIVIGTLFDYVLYNEIYNELKNQYIKGYYREEEYFNNKEKEVTTETKDEEVTNETNKENDEEIEVTKTVETEIEDKEEYQVRKYKKEIADKLNQGEYVEELFYGEHIFSYGYGELVLLIQKNERLAFSYNYNTHLIEFRGTLNLYRLILPTLLFVFLLVVYLFVHLMILLAFLLISLKEYIYNQKMKDILLRNNGEEQELIGLPTYFNIFEILAIRLGNYVLNVDREIFDEYYRKRRDDSIMVTFYRSYYMNRSRSDGFIDQVRFAERIKECVYNKLYAENYVKEKRDFKKVFDRIRGRVDDYKNKINPQQISNNNILSEVDRIQKEREKLFQNNMNRVTNYGIIIAVIIVLIALTYYLMLIPLMIFFIIELSSFRVRYTKKGELFRYQLKQYEKYVLKKKADDELTIEEEFYKKIITRYPNK